jgi:hypothetical protein
MLKIFIRSAAAFAFSIFGKTIIAFVLAVLLCLATALLVDLRLYLSAGVTGALAAVSLVVFIVQYIRQQKVKRERARRAADEAIRRAAAAQARNQKMDRAKAAVSDTVKGMASGAADAAKSGYSGARGRIDGWRK